MNKLRTYIKKQLKKGVKEQDILDTLQENGYELQEATSALQNTKQQLKKLHITIVALAAILAVLLTFLVISTQEVATPQTPVVEQPPQENTTPPEPEPQEDVYEPSSQEEIIIQAIQENNPALCQQLDSEWREECEAEFITEDAYEPSSQEEIIIQAIQTGNQSLCEQLEGDWREQCQAEFQ